MQDGIAEFQQLVEGKSLYDFISGIWSDIWFFSQFYNQNNYNNLGKVYKDHSKAMMFLRSFWSTELTPIPTLHSNICAGQAIKFIQDLLPVC